MLVKTIQVQPLTHQNYLEASKVLAVSLCHSEPIIKYLGVTFEEVVPLAVSACQQAADDAVSVIASSEGKITGCFIMEKLNRPIDLTPYQNNKKLKVLLSTLRHLGLRSAFSAEEKIIPPLFLGVNIPYLRYRVAGRLFCEGVKCAQIQGYEHFIIEARAPYTLNFLSAIK